MRLSQRIHRATGCVWRPQGLQRSHAVARMVLPLAAGAVLAPLPLWSGGAMASSPLPVPHRLVCPALVREEAVIVEAIWGVKSRKDSSSPQCKSETKQSSAMHAALVLPPRSDVLAFEKQGYLPHPPHAGCFDQTIAPPRLPRSPPE